ncbi:MAG: response regulator [Anaerolineales bacterium]|nr:response regulator [Anaerolineales bacterium]
MPETTSYSKVASIAGEGPIQQQIAAALGSQSDFHLVAELSTFEGVTKELYDTQPDIILIDHALDEEQALDTIDEISLQHPTTAIVVILLNNDPVQAQQIMLAGARAFLVQPFTQTNLISTLRRVCDLESRRRISPTASAFVEDERDEPLQILSVFSPRGGVGCSTIAINVALALHEEIECNVLLMDGKLLFGHLGLMMNIRSNNSIADLIPHANALDTGLVKDVVTKHSSGIEVLLAPTDVQAGQGIRPDDLFNVMRGIRRMYDFVIVDAGSFLNENTVTLMDLSDRILLVATPDLAALHDVSRFVQISRTLAYPSGKLLIILNRAGMLGGVKTKDISVALRHKPFAQIPDDEGKVIRSLNQGVPLIFKHPRHPVSRSIKNLANMLASIGMEEQAQRKPGTSSVVPKLRARAAPTRAG